MEYKGWIRCNFLRCFEDNLFSIGDAVAADAASTVVEHEEGNNFLRLVLKDERLRGVEAVNLAAIHPGVFVSLIREQLRLSESRDLLLVKPRETASWLMQQQRRAQAL
jgi:NAD(P)H-nitrite reductase large subunit